MWASLPHPTESGPYGPTPNPLDWQTRTSLRSVARRCVLSQRRATTPCTGVPPSGARCAFSSRGARFCGMSYAETDWHIRQKKTASKWPVVTCSSTVVATYSMYVQYTNPELVCRQCCRTSWNRGCYVITLRRHAHDLSLLYRRLVSGGRCWPCYELCQHPQLDANDRFSDHKPETSQTRRRLFQLALASLPRNTRCKTNLKMDGGLQKWINCSDIVLQLAASENCFWNGF